MANEPQNTMAGKPDVTGGIAVAPVGTARPTDATTPLIPEWKKLGLVSDDGVTRTIDRTTESWKEWGGSEYRSVTSEHTLQYAFTLVEVMRLDVLHFIFGKDNVTRVDGVTTIKINAKQPPVVSVLFLIVDEEGDVKRNWREYIPRAQVIAGANDLVFKAGEPIRFAVELKGLIDAEGNKAYSIIEDIPSEEE